jgi:hypothetical protein
VADLDPVDLLRVGPDVTDRHAAHVERDDLVVKAIEAPLVVAHDLGLKRAGAIARRADRHAAALGVQRLGGAGVAAVGGPARRRVPAPVAEVVGQLGVHRALDEPPGQLRQQPALAGDLRRRARAGQQLVDQLIPKLARTGRPGRLVAVGPVVDDRDVVVVDGYEGLLSASRQPRPGPSGPGRGDTIASSEARPHTNNLSEKVAW